MKRNALIVSGLLFGASAALPRPALAFSTVAKFPYTASVTISETAFAIQPSTLPATAFFGKNVVIPMEVTANPNGLRVDIVYQLLDANGAVLTAPTSIPITFTQSPTNPNQLNGSAIIPVSDLQAIQNGGQIQYIFQAQQNGVGTIYNTLGYGQASNSSTLPSPFTTTINNYICQNVGPAGARVSAPDLFVHDGETAVSLPPGAVSAPESLCIKEEDPTLWPLGPGGSKPAAIYTITLEPTSLVGTAELILSYPSDVNGKVLPSEAEPGSLGIYWLDRTNGAFPSGQWQPLSQASVDTTLHTVTGMTPHFSTFALFATGAVGSTDLRPPQRIITPNGDGINDYAIFGAVDQIKIFDVRGRRIREINAPSSECGGAFCWDGKDDSGKIVEGGVYIYQYTSQGSRVSGVIGVAK